MEELSKVRRVVAQRLPGAPHETLLTIDATTGQNGLQQARRFAAATDVTGIVLTKLDGSAKGGIAIAIAHELGIPIKLIGIGESLEDLRPVRSAGVRAGAACAAYDAVSHTRKASASVPGSAPNTYATVGQRRFRAAERTASTMQSAHATRAGVNRSAIPRVSAATRNAAASATATATGVRRRSSTSGMIHLSASGHVTRRPTRRPASAVSRRVPSSQDSCSPLPFEAVR